MARRRLLVDLGPLRQSQAVPAALGRLPRDDARFAAHGRRDSLPGVQADALLPRRRPRRAGPDRARARRRRCSAGRSPTPSTGAACCSSTQLSPRGLQRRAGAQRGVGRPRALAAVRAQRPLGRRRQHRHADALRGVRESRRRARCSRARTPSGSCCSRSGRWPDPRSPACCSARSASPRSTGSTRPPSRCRCWRSRAFPRFVPAGAAPVSGCVRSPRASDT